MKLRHGLAALALFAAAVPATAQELTTLKVLTPVPRTASWYPILVGEALGYFEEAGIVIDLVPGGDLPATAFLENGSVDIASLDAPQVVQAQARGIDLDVVYEVMHGAVEGVFVKADNPAQSLSELGNTTIGIVGESDRSLLVTALDIAGVPLDSVQIVVLGESAPLLANSLDSGQVAGIVGGPSDLVSLRSQGLEIRNLLPEEIGDLPANSFAMRADRIEELRPVMEGFFQAWGKSVYAAEADPEVVAAIAKQAVPENWIREDLGQLLLDVGFTLHKPDNGIYGELRSGVWTNLQEDLMTAGEISQMYDNATFLNDAYIASANDFDRDAVAADLAAWKAENM
ncbi:ABC transporter substrate-binding protein [Palleronia sp. KMU-117]|uniref:ABC transporter substrate-binding protein n=1 Tax=Palleronia sp. KMU-117 TaxID=3434108 RepID=UPI003D72BDB6